jgi:hypothetical protein
MNHDELDRLLRDYGEHWRSTQTETSPRASTAPPRPGGRWHLRRIAPAAAAVAAAIVIGVVVVGTGGRQHDAATTEGGTARQPSPSQLASTTPSESAASPYANPIRARRLARTSGPNLLSVGAPVPSSEVAHPIRLRGRTLVGLGAKGALFQTVYPVCSTDGGGHWRICGPLMYRAGASGPAVADSIGVLPDGVVYVWGRGGNFIRVAKGGTPPWYAANLPSVTRVWNEGNTLLARTYPEPGTPNLFRSSDGGHTWTTTR